MMTYPHATIQHVSFPCHQDSSATETQDKGNGAVRAIGGQLADHWLKAASRPGAGSLMTLSGRRRGGRNVTVVTQPPTTEPVKRGRRQPALSTRETGKRAKTVPVVLEGGAVERIVGSVLRRLDGHPEHVLLHGIDKTRSDLLSNLSCAISDWRGNSSILVGPRASGKSTLVHQLVRRVGVANPAVHLEHLTLHGSVFSETMSALKYLLGRLKQLVAGSAVIDHAVSVEDVSEYLAYDQITALVRQYTATRSSKRFLVFVLEDVDKFAAHPQQNLLYCLFELALALPVYVIGVSCRIDVLELLEKRVKSRFSQNIVFLPMSETMGDFVSRIQTNLCVTEEASSSASDGGSIVAYNAVMQQFTRENAAFLQICEFYFDLTRDVRPVFRLLTVALSRAASHVDFDWQQFGMLFEVTIRELRPDPRGDAAVLGTTVVELLVLVAMCRLAAKFPSLAVTFDVVLEEVRTVKLRAPSLERFSWSRSTVQAAFDRLLACRLLLPATLTANASLDRSYLTVRLGQPYFMVTEAIERHPHDSKEIVALACERF